MNRTIQVKGIDKVMAMFREPWEYYSGKWEDVIITGVSENEYVPVDVRIALVGLTIPTIFTKESIERQTGETFPIPKNSRLAYYPDVAEVLRIAGKNNEANKLINMFDNPLKMYTINPDIYEMPKKSFSMEDFRGNRHPFKKDGGFVYPYR